MGGLAFKAVQKRGSDAVTTSFASLWDIPTIDIDGNKVERLGQCVQGKKCVMVVNVASK